MKTQETTFYEKLQNCRSLDLRDNRGKRHDMCFILYCMMFSLMRGRDGNLSSIHRTMANYNDQLRAELSIDSQSVVSRAQLPNILAKVSLPSFETILFEHYSVKLDEQEKQWFAVDGKELRGSIVTGAKRGEAIVQAVCHKGRVIVGQTFYNGQKESEKPAVRSLLEQTAATNQKISADALHLNPKTTTLINQAGGLFLIGLKGNQQELLEDMNKYAYQSAPICEHITSEEGHGRIEQRTYEHYNIGEEFFAKRWQHSNFSSLFKVKRQISNSKTGERHTKTHYYLSNVAPDPSFSNEFFIAIREHWSVEVVNHVRDVTFKEDALKTKVSCISKTLAGLRTLGIKLLEILKPKNMVAQLEFFQDRPMELISWLRQIRFL